MKDSLASASSASANKFIFMVVALLLSLIIISLNLKLIQHVIIVSSNDDDHDVRELSMKARIYVPNNQTCPAILENRVPHV